MVILSDIEDIYVENDDEDELDEDNPDPIIRPGADLLNGHEILENIIKNRKEKTRFFQIANKKVVLVKLLDNKAVCLASNYLGKDEEDKVKRWEKNSKYIEINRPEVIKDYNHGMGGVEFLDQSLIVIMGFLFVLGNGHFALSYICKLKLIRMYSERIPVKALKYKDLQTLRSILTNKQHRSFYDSIKCTQSYNAVDDIEEEDTSRAYEDDLK
ncbi:hypothetical protein ILUMI_15044 [Ignelater luminosus]|uniref:PiggyBac transposable element-derived protein domain-containing protein n=1 Tax=Ignelater luminosus TaxID=2038154 RepID=A0A8K0CPC7_IGNLU|nr:hypothetical protein ILUMI_15044 [Ignelater luminosus]